MRTRAAELLAETARAQQAAVRAFPGGTREARLRHHPGSAQGEKGLGTGNTADRKHALLPCGHLDFQSVVTAKNDEFRGCFHSSYSRSLGVKTWPRNSIRSLVTYRYVC